MKNSKKDLFGKNQLKSNSTLFLQLGILLALVFVYGMFELKFSNTVFDLPDKTVASDDLSIYVYPPVHIEKSNLPVDKIQNKLPKLLTKVIIDNRDIDKPSQDFLLKKPQKSINYDSIFDNLPLIDEDSKEESVPFVLVEQAPRYPGCKGKTEADYKKCFNDKVKRFISKKFNSNIDIDLSGKQKIYVLFEIDKYGDIININAKAPHKRLEKEAINVVNKLPKMEPGKQRNRNVGVKYVLPIVFEMH